MHCSQCIITLYCTRCGQQPSAMENGMIAMLWTLEVSYSWRDSTTLVPTAVKFCQRVFHHLPVLHGRQWVNWSAKVSVPVSYLPRKWAALLWQDKSAPFREDNTVILFAASTFAPVASWVMLILSSSALSLNSCKDTSLPRLPGTPSWYNFH